jgi:hypothetical protein
MASNKCSAFQQGIKASRFDAIEMKSASNSLHGAHQCETTVSTPPRRDVYKRLHSIALQILTRRKPGKTQQAAPGIALAAALRSTIPVVAPTAVEQGCPQNTAWTHRPSIKFRPLLNNKFNRNVNQFMGMLFQLNIYRLKLAIWSGYR